MDVKSESDNLKGDSFPLNEIIEAIKRIRYGYVLITIQDSKVIQIDRTEKLRLDKKRG